MKTYHTKDYDISCEDNMEIICDNEGNLDHLVVNMTEPVSEYDISIGFHPIQTS